MSPEVSEDLQCQTCQKLTIDIDFTTQIHDLQKENEWNIKQIWYKSQQKCDKCGQNFQYLRHLLRHQNSHQSSQFNCNLCDKIFSRTDKLREHVQKEHGVEDTKALSCIHCQKTFSRRDKMNAHMKYSCKQTLQTDPSSVH